MENAKDCHNRVFQLLLKHDELFRNSIPLVASENMSSKAIRDALNSDFGNRYAAGWPGERVYAGCTYIDEKELACIDKAKRFFRSEFADVRPISGAVAVSSRSETPK